MPGWQPDDGQAAVEAAIDDDAESGAAPIDTSDPWFQRQEAKESA